MIPIKVLQHGFKLVRASANASAFDIVTPVDFVLTKGCRLDIKLGIKSQIPTGYVGLMAPRSGLGSKGMQVRNTVAFMDSDFRGEWEARLTLADWAKNDSMSFKRGERIIQVCFPALDTVVEYVDEVDETERGEGGFNSTGTGIEVPETNLTQRLRRVIPSAVLTHEVHHCKSSKVTQVTLTVYHNGMPLKVGSKLLQAQYESGKLYTQYMSGAKDICLEQVYCDLVPELIEMWQAAE